MKHLTRIYFLLLCLAPLFAGAQNLVPNPSFETYTSCAGGGANVGNCPPWQKPVGHGGSADHFMVCSPGTFGVPTNTFGDQAARTGVAYIGFVTYFVSANFREYAQVQLTSPLLPGQTYDVQAYFSLGDPFAYATDGYGFYLSNAPVTSAAGPLPYAPQVEQPSGTYLTDKLGWTAIGGSFVATGGEQWITVGNFRNDAATTYTNVGGWTWNYSYMDDISVSLSVVLSADLLSVRGKWRGEDAQLSWSTSSEQGTDRFIVERSLGVLNQWEAVGEVAAAGDSDELRNYDFVDPGADPQRVNYYRIQVLDLNGGHGYSKLVELQGDDLVDHFAGLYPNPAVSGGQVALEIVLAQSKTVDIEVMDLTGKMLHAQAFEATTGLNRLEIQLPALATGYYLIRYRMDGFQETQKLLVRGN
jgi:hypothetical protein